MATLIFIQGKPVPVPGEYKYTQMLRSNYTWVAIFIQIITGFALGVKYQYNPLRIGICLIGIFPLTATLESICYRGSHNLIPLEFAVYFLYSLPTACAAYAGKWIIKERHR